MAKAVLITKSNIKSLEDQYQMEEGDLDGCDGLYLTADFDATTVTYGVLDKDTLETNFTQTGKQLENGYFEVMRKAA